PNLSQRINADGTLSFENEDHSYDGSTDTRAVPGDPLAVLRELAAQIVRAGVKRITGNVLVDATLFPDAGPENGTGAFVSPIVVNDNLVDVMVSPGAGLGDPVTISALPQTPYVTFVNRATTSAAGSEPTLDMNADVSNADGTHTVTVSGTQPAGAPMLYAYRVPEPRLFAQMALRVALKDAGVTIEGTPITASFVRGAFAGSYTQSHLIASHLSPPLAQDAYVTLKVSDNLHADLMPYVWATYTKTATADLLKSAFAQERRFLQGAGLNLDGASQQDGLGSSAFFTPDFMVHYLAWVRNQSWYPQLLHGLPILGVDGTLFNIENNSPAKGRVFAKTGTWGSDNLLDDDGLVTKGLAGYTTTRQGHHIAFAFYINRMPGKHSAYAAKDAAHAAGEILGAMATAAYELL
ncbi:MAG: D-alanyl-D-alanine carboxypeptidase/D-alanyl-D-alanine-endopeptidase, partial [Candidatus Eremiobacteraeota bacterium]|nr:D-alanyl-D-alanine carboxypeptidase/D-alanyl-D-alanine-endopeptidase [Candidatus Eremiobacteraeota bacterium]